MRSKVVLAKLSRPTSTGVIARERLFVRIDAARTGPLLWISGPPGGGKTTLASTYIETRMVPHIWYQIDAGDHDPSNVFHHLGLAVPGRKRSQSLVPHDQSTDLTGFSMRFFRSLYARSPAGLTLVFDGFHKLPAVSPTNAVIRIAVEQAPPGTTIVVLSRTAPPPAMAALRAAGRLALIDGQELRLSLDETACIVGIGPAEASRLQDACGGWPAGLRLLLAAGARASATAVDLEHVADYFAEEVLARQPAHARDFLLQTSVVTNLTPSLAAALSQNSRAGAILEGLHRTNTFTERRGDPAVTYRYHDLFRACLRDIALREWGDVRMQDLQTRAAAILEAHDDIEAAVVLYLEAGEWAAAARVILAGAPRLIAQGRLPTLHRWVRDLPGLLVERSGALLYCLGTARIASNPCVARVALERAFARFGIEGNVAGQAQAAAGIIETFYFEQGDYRPLDPWIASLQALLVHGVAFPSGEAELRAWSMLQTAITFRHPAHPFLSRCAEHVLELLSRPLDINQRVRAAALLLTCFDWFQTEKASGLVGLLRPALADRNLADFHRVWWQLTEFHHFRQSGDSVAATQALDAWRRSLTAAGLRAPAVAVLMVELWGASGSGDLASVDALMSKLLATAGYASLRAQEQTLLLSLQAEWLLLKRDFRAAADVLATAVDLTTSLGCEGHEIQLHLAAVVAHTGLGEFAVAREHVDRLDALLPAVGAEKVRYGALLVSAFRALRCGECAEAETCLERAFALGRRYGYVNAFLWLPWMASELVVHALVLGIETEYACRLVRARQLQPPGNRPAAWPWPVRIYCLGPLEIFLDGIPLAFPGKAPKRPLALLAGLLSRGGRQVGAQALWDALWPDLEGDAAADAFTMALHRMRKILGSDAAILLQDGRLSLNPALCWVDAWAFDECADAAHDIPSLDAALDLYRGHFLESDAPQAWSLATRDRHRTQMLQAIERVAGTEAAAGRHESAARIYGRGQSIDPLCEALYQGQIRCLLNLGQRAEAARVYARCADMLAAAFNVTPSLETSEMLQRLPTR